MLFTAILIGSTALVILRRLPRDGSAMMHRAAA